jgi:hypothetical protein
MPKASSGFVKLSIALMFIFEPQELYKPISAAEIVIAIKIKIKLYTEMIFLKGFLLKKSEILISSIGMKMI